MKLVLASPSLCRPPFLSIEGCSVHTDLETAVTHVMEEEGNLDDWYFYDFEVGDSITFEMKPLRKEVPVRKK